jgi:hypothetical protein
MVDKVFRTAKAFREVLKWNGRAARPAPKPQTLAAAIWPHLPTGPNRNHNQRNANGNANSKSLQMLEAYRVRANRNPTTTKQRSESKRT